MIDESTKRKFLKELEKSGNVYLASLKVGIHRDSHYRWKKEDKEYRKLSTLAEKIGRENNCDVAEHALMLNVKDKKMEAIKYLLAHNSKKYKPSKSNEVTINHRSFSKTPVTPPVTLEDVMDEWVERGQQRADRLAEEFKGFELPLKPNGKPIEEHELASYEGYIRDFQKLKIEQKEKERMNKYRQSIGLPPIS